MKRREFLAACAASQVLNFLPRRSSSASEGQSRRGDVPWLAEMQAPPAGVPADAAGLSTLLIDDRNEAITDLAGWRTRREQIVGFWKELLGEVVVPPRPPVGWIILDEDRRDGVIRRLVRYEAEPNDPVEAYWLMPRLLTRRAPGVVVHHSTVDYSIRQPAGLEGPPEKHFGLKLAQRGFVTLCPRNYLWPENSRLDAAGRAAEFLVRQPQANGMAKMLFSSQLAVDFLSALPEVDASRIGAVGHSLGAKEVLYLAAFDPRVKATVSSEGGVGVTFSNWRDAWYLGSEAADKRFPRDHHELLALAAPRSFLLIGGESADGDRGWPYINSALPVWKLYSEPAPLAFYNHRKGHSVPPEAEAKIYEWLETYV